MSVRLVLAAAAILVMGASVYLLHEIRATPAEAEPVAASRAGDHDPAPAEPAEADDAERSEPSVRSRQPRTVRLGDVVHRAAPPPVQSAAPAAAPEHPGDDKPYRLDALMDEANKAYDRMDFDEARAIATRVLDRFPDNVRMLRIMVSAACIEGDSPVAQKWWVQLPERHREQMKTRCMKYGVTFVDPPR